MYEKIKPYIIKGLISEQVHPEDSDVRIFNYSPMCQYEGAWDEVTMKCRGLILNVKTGEQLSNPFPKFFNYEEHIQKGLALPGSPYVVQDKLDGWLGISYWLDGVPRIATRGSFTSTGAMWATEWLNKNISKWHLSSDKTFLFEIISPLTKIVLNYDFEGLVLTSIRDIKTGEEQRDFPYPEKFRRVKEFPQYDYGYDFLKSKEEKNKEGFVLFWPKENFRLKVKFDEYKRLHKIITGISAIGIWESLRAGQSLSIDNVPDEFMNWFTKTKENLLDDYKDIEFKAKNEYTSFNTSMTIYKELSF